MFVIWSGWGILVIPLVLGTAVAIGAIVSSALTAFSRPDLAFLAFATGLFAAAAVNWPVGRRLNSEPGRELVDPTTHERILLQRRHKLFWIKMEYWSVPVALTAFIPLLALRHLDGN
jgi:hypothetical protein